MDYWLSWDYESKIYEEKSNFAAVKISAFGGPQLTAVLAVGERSEESRRTKKWKDYDKNPSYQVCTDVIKG